jgi:membrane protease YdiL (CAAX protease family)
MDARALVVPVALIVGACKAWWQRRHGVGAFAALGLEVDRSAALDAVAGTAISVASLFLIFLGAWRAGLLAVHGHGPASSLLFDWSTPVVVALVEEFVFRAVLLGVLLLWIGGPVAVVVSAAAFAALHLGNANITALALVCHLIAGLIYGVAFVGTQRIWLPFGLHLGWNYAEGRLLGFALSGGAVPSPFILQSAKGPALWTGGEYGPEGGLIGIIGKLLVAALTLGYLWQQNRLWRVGAARNSALR